MGIIEWFLAGGAPCANLQFSANNNQLTSIGGLVPSYDAAGEMLSDGTGMGTNQYTWNVEGKTATVTPWGGATDTYIYDGDGNRVEDTGAQTLFWHGADGQLLEVSEPNGPTNRAWIYFAGRRIARYDQNTGWAAYYLYDDANGSLRVMTNSSGSVLCQADYYPFGEPVGTGCGGYDHFEFAGLYSDFTYTGAGNEDGNMSAANRRLNSTLGRWLSPDPGGMKVVNVDDPQTWNLYVYSHDNPVTFNDPSGLCFDPVDCAIEFGAAGSIFGPEGTVGGAILGAAMGAGIGYYAAKLVDHIHQSSSNSAPSPASTEQGRDAQGKFLPKQPGQTQPGADAERGALEAEGATKTGTTLAGTNRRVDGTVTGTGQKIEVKSGESVSNTGQLVATGEAAAKATGKPLLVVTTNPNVHVSAPAQDNENLQIRPVRKPQP